MKCLPVVANWELTRLPIIPCKPTVALANPKATKLSAFVHAGSPLNPAIEPCPPFQTVRAAAMVNNAWIIVPRNSHARVFEPILSPMRPREAPPRKVRSETSACLSAISNSKLVLPGEKSRAIARANYERKKGCLEFNDV